MQRGAAFLGTDYAILGGAMTWVSERTLVAAISNAGGFGVIASGSMPPEILRAEIKATQVLTEKPFGVNLIVMHPQLEELVAVCIAENVKFVVLAGGMPSAAILMKLKDAGCRTIGFAPALVVGKRLIKHGIDALIIEGSEAGGHIGAVSTTVLAQEILPLIQEVPVFVAGGIGRGEAIVAYLEMGAAGCQLGTRFVCATESTAHPAFKAAFIKANARDAVASVQLDSRLPVIPVRALANKGTRAFLDVQTAIISKLNNNQIELKAAQLEIEHYWAGALRRAAVEGDVENGSLMAGQSVGMVTEEQPLAAIIQELIAQANTHLHNRLSFSKQQGA
jgi:enoyl-[acyl-carrier protein] reductase II